MSSSPLQARLSYLVDMKGIDIANKKEEKVAMSLNTRSLFIW